MGIKEVNKPPLHRCKYEFDPSQVAVLITSHPGQQIYWDQCLSRWNDSPYFVLMGYDDVNDEKIKEPLKKYRGISEVFCTGQRTGHVAGELLQFKMGFTRLYEMGFTYSMKVGSDHLIRKMDGIADLWKLLEGRYYKDPPQSILPPPDAGQIVGIETAFMFGFTSIFYAMFSSFNREMQRPGDAEAYSRYRRRMFNVKFVNYPPGVRYEWDNFSLLEMSHVQGLDVLERRKETGKRIRTHHTWEDGEIYK